MEVIRKVKIKVGTDAFLVGDQITVSLKGFGKFTATAQEVTEKGTLFFFDTCLPGVHRINRRPSNEGGFNASELCEWLNTKLLAAFPTQIRNKMTQDASGNLVTIPTYGQLFGGPIDDWDRDHIEIDSARQLPLMKDRKNRMCGFDLDYWLQNSLQRRYSDKSFAYVDEMGGYVCNECVTYYVYVRPVFILGK